MSSACDPPQVAGPPPLRPLLYTEAPPPADLPGWEDWTDPARDPVAWPSQLRTTLAVRSLERTEVPQPAATPELLLQGVFEAFRRQDPALLAPYLFDGPELARAGRMGEEAARAEAANIQAQTLEAMALLAPDSPSRARPEVLAALLIPGQIVIGRPRDVTGRLIPANGREPTVMHWGSELELAVADTNARLHLRFPRILRDTAGNWRLGGAPTPDDRFFVWRGLGLDRKPELMDADHAPFPLRMGNFWHYRTRRPGIAAAGATGSSGSAATPGDDGSYGLLTPNGYRDEVTSVEAQAGYRLVRFRRLYDNPARDSETFAWLQTPLTVYRCPRECIRRIEDLDWLLTWANQQTPHLRFPLEPGQGWGAGGRDARTNVWRTHPESQEVTVPAGVFATTIALTRSTAGGRESAFVAPGIGVVMRRIVAGTETDVEELIQYRIMP